MSCVQCVGIEEVFSQEYVAKQLTRYRNSGPDRTTCMLAEAIKDKGISGLTLLDIGGGLGGLQHELIEAGVDYATDVDASKAYLEAASEEAKRQGYAERISFHYGNFVEIAANVPQADIVTLDRVICCYPDMQKLVSLSASRARVMYGLVYPRDTWWIKAGIAIANFFLRARRSSFRAFSHSTKAVEAILDSFGFKRCFYREARIWQVAVYSREPSST